MEGMKVDEKEFSTKFAQATEHLSPEEKRAVFKLFENISQQLSSNEISGGSDSSSVSVSVYSDEDKDITGLTPRLERLKAAYLKVKPSVFVQRAVVTTEVYRENAGMPKNASCNGF